METKTFSKVLQYFNKISLAIQQKSFVVHEQEFFHINWSKNLQSIQFVLKKSAPAQVLSSEISTIFKIIYLSQARTKID